MKTTFTKEYMLNKNGRDTPDYIDKIPFDENEEITLQGLFDCMDIGHFNEVLCENAELTDIQLQSFALANAKHVLSIYEKKNPECDIVRECINHADRYLAGMSTIQEVQRFRHKALSVSKGGKVGFANVYSAARSASTAAYCAYTSLDKDTIAATAAFHADQAVNYAVLYNCVTTSSYKEMIRVFVFETIFPKQPEKTTKQVNDSIEEDLKIQHEGDVFAYVYMQKASDIFFFTRECYVIKKGIVFLIEKSGHVPTANTVFDTVNDCTNIGKYDPEADYHRTSTDYDYGEVVKMSGL